ncbi:MAG: hypothetical protein N3G20_10090 [Verrucomicrobiae bacterium]|nr:hypothetical protein [Verrucomicrobiae bacterium]
MSALAPGCWHTDQPLPDKRSVACTPYTEPRTTRPAKFQEIVAQKLWCAACGKRHQSTSDACNCGSGQHLREIEILHRQCPNNGVEYLESDVKHLLPQCPNCLARNTLGVEPVRRFSETDDEAGIAVAIPLAHFDVSPWRNKEEWQIRNLLCFADQRHKAAAFPSLLEDKTFPWDFGRQVLQIVREANGPLRYGEIAKRLAKMHTDETVPPEGKLLLPVSVQLNEENPDWDRFFTAHVFAYFGVPDPARESAEDLGVLRVRYELSRPKFEALHQVMQPSGLSQDESLAFLQTLFGFARKRKAFRLPDAVPQNHPAFWRVSADICLAKEKAAMTNVVAFVSAVNNPKGNEITNYISRVLNVDIQEARSVAGTLWDVLVDEAILRQEDDSKFRLYPSQLLVESAPNPVPVLDLSHYHDVELPKRLSEKRMRWEAFSDHQRPTRTVSNRAVGIRRLIRPVSVPGKRRAYRTNRQRDRSAHRGGLSQPMSQLAQFYNDVRNGYQHRRLAKGSFAKRAAQCRFLHSAYRACWPW